MLCFSPPPCHTSHVTCHTSHVMGISPVPALSLSLPSPSCASTVAVLHELLSQRRFCLDRRGRWFDRLALHYRLEEHCSALCQIALATSLSLSRSPIFFCVTHNLFLGCVSVSAFIPVYVCVCLLASTCEMLRDLCPSVKRRWLTHTSAPATRSVAHS